MNVSWADAVMLNFVCRGCWRAPEEKVCLFAMLLWDRWVLQHLAPAVWWLLLAWLLKYGQCLQHAVSPACLSAPAAFPGPTARALACGFSGAWLHSTVPLPWCLALVICVDQQHQVASNFLDTVWLTSQCNATNKTPPYGMASPGTLFRSFAVSSRRSLLLWIVFPEGGFLAGSTSVTS